MKRGANCQAPGGAGLKHQDKERGSFKVKGLCPGRAGRLSKPSAPAQEASALGRAPGPENSDETGPLPGIVPPRRTRCTPQRLKCRSQDPGRAPALTGLTRAGGVSLCRRGVLLAQPGLACGEAPAKARGASGL